VTDFVLVHGGSHGAWCWADLIAELERLGHRAYALDLPGHGDEPTPRASVTLDAYVAAVEHFIADRHLDDFTPVGHSIAGMILPDVVSRCDARVSEVVFLAALVLDAGHDVMLSAPGPLAHLLAGA